MPTRSPARAGAAWLALGLATLGCAGADPGTPPPAAAVDEKVWRMLARHHTFFGHQSVGRDLLAGIAQLAGDATAPRVVESTMVPDLVARAPEPGP